MMRPVVLSAASLILASCGGRSSLPTEPIVQPAAKSIDARLCAPLKPEPPVEGSIVQPVTAAEADATRDHLASDAEARAWGREGWERAAVAAEPCEPPPRVPPRPG